MTVYTNVADGQTATLHMTVPALAGATFPHVQDHLLLVLMLRCALASTAAGSCAALCSSATVICRLPLHCCCCTHYRLSRWLSKSGPAFKVVPGVNTALEQDCISASESGWRNSGLVTSDVPHITYSLLCCLSWSDTICIFSHFQCCLEILRHSALPVSQRASGSIFMALCRAPCVRNPLGHCFI